MAEGRPKYREKLFPLIDRDEIIHDAYLQMAAQAAAQLKKEAWKKYWAKKWVPRVGQGKPTEKLKSASQYRTDIVTI